MERRGRRRTKGSQSGQAIVLMVISLVVMLGCAALVIDLGLGWWAKRELQAQVDAAALAGAQELPNSSTAVSRAQEYLALNPTKGAKGVQATITTACNTTVPGCNPVNSVRITATGTAATGFARLFGIDAMEIKAGATACSPCGAKPLDVMIVLDRTGSMNTSSKMTHAKNGIRTFLGFMDPSGVNVALAVLPPAKTLATRCTTVPTSTSDYTNYDSLTAAWVIVPFSSDYRIKGGGLNPNSDLIKTLNCQNPGGYTHYAVALDKAQEYLKVNGRPKVQDVIIFLTDGAANTAPHTGAYASATHPYRKRPCASGVTAANAAKVAGTWVYTIGYAIGGSEKCLESRATPQKPNNPAESPTITPDQALQQMASPGNYYNRPDPGQLSTIFSAIAGDISSGASKLID
jgi:Flp pilus assembly protein TadG